MGINPQGIPNWILQAVTSANKPECCYVALLHQASSSADTQSQWPLHAFLTNIPEDSPPSFELSRQIELDKVLIARSWVQSWPKGPIAQYDLNVAVQEIEKWSQINLPVVTVTLTKEFKFEGERTDEEMSDSGQTLMHRSDRRCHIIEGRQMNSPQRRNISCIALKCNA